MESFGVDPFVASVREVVVRQLVAGRPPIQMVARTVAMSVRTLQRRLSDHGWNYSGFVDAVRSAEARRRVAHPQSLFKAVAIDLGFAEQASFTRAFRRWTGLTPREYRRRSIRAAAAHLAGGLAGEGSGPREQDGATSASLVAVP